MKEKLDKINEDTWIISDLHLGHKNILSFEPCRLTQMRIDGYDDDEHDAWVVDTWNKTVSPDDTVLVLGDFSFKTGYYTEYFEKCYEKFKDAQPDILKKTLKLHKPKSLNDIMKIKIASNGSIEKEHFKSFISNYIPENEYYTRYEDILNGNIILVLGNHDPKPKQFLNRNVEVIDGFYHYMGDILNKVQHPDPMFSGFIKEINNKKYLFCHYALFNNDSWDLQNKMIAPRIKILEKIYELSECDYNIHGHLHSNKSIFEDSINVCFEHLSFRPQRLISFIK